MENVLFLEVLPSQAPDKTSDNVSIADLIVDYEPSTFMWLTICWLQILWYGPNVIRGVLTAKRVKDKDRRNRGLIWCREDEPIRNWVNTSVCPLYV